MGNNPKSSGLQTSFELSPEGLKKLQTKIVKPRMPRTKQEVDEAIVEVKNNIDSNELKLKEVREKIRQGSEYFTDSELNYIEEEHLEYELEMLNERLRELEMLNNNFKY